MKNGWNKKKIIIIAVVTSLCLTAFWSWNMPKLINADKPFIDLSGSIGESIGNANEAYEKAVMTPIPDNIIVPIVTPTVAPEINDDNPNEIRIVVGDEDYAGPGETIRIERGVGLDVKTIKFDSFSTFEETLKDASFDGIALILVDDYAETKTMLQVKKILDKFGIIYSVESVKEE